MTGSTTDSVTVRIPAKVNVQLGVGGRRPDGFHALANIFLAVGLYDTVTASPLDSARGGQQGRGGDDGYGGHGGHGGSAEHENEGHGDEGHGDEGHGGVELTASGAFAHRVPLDSSNLAARAARLLAERHGLGEPRVRLHIVKDIPVAGGMAGGSADAAGALAACDALWGTATPQEELLKLCAELGSDVPFSLLGGAALGQGRGELLTPLVTDGVFHWVFAVADGGLSTPAVYRECDRLREEAGGGADATDVPEPEASREVVRALATGDARALAAALSNDLQPAAVSLRPPLADTLAAGRAAGALAGLVSGSGPTCAFLTEDAESAATVARALTDSGTCRAAYPATGPAPGATRAG